MKIPKKTLSSINCVLGIQKEFPVRTRQIRLEVNQWRADNGKKPLSRQYFSWVVHELEKTGVIRCVRGTQMPYWDDCKYWVAT